MQAEDSLSRRSDHKDGVELNNAEKVLLKPEFFAISAIDTFYELVFNNFKILREIKTALLSNDIMKNYKSLLNSGPREFSKSLQDWNFKNSLLLYREKSIYPTQRITHYNDKLYMPTTIYLQQAISVTGKYIS